MRLELSILGLTAAAIFAVGAAAQAPPESPMIVGGQMGAVAVRQNAGLVTMGFEGMDASPVKGAPFCANISTEHTQQFADGNRIHTTNTSLVCRDSEGRIRREADLNFLGALPQTSPGKLITIIDPVGGFRYVLDGQAKVARKMPLMLPKSIDASKGAAGPETAAAGGRAMFRYQVADAGGPGTVNSFYIVRKGKGAEGPAPTTENLGEKTINGVHATGTRITTTIPAGQMGNDLPIKVVSERWYSPDLKATVMTKHSDPWAGELMTQFTSVNTSEPDPSLFTVPSDYKIVNEQPFVIHKKLLPPASP